MKKKIVLTVFLGLFLLATPIFAAAQVTSQATITFVQKTNANQTIPMKRIEMPKPSTQSSKTVSAPFRFFPKTNAVTGSFLFLLGTVFLLMLSFLAFKKKRKIKQF